MAHTIKVKELKPQKQELDLSLMKDVIIKSRFVPVTTEDIERLIKWDIERVQTRDNTKEEVVDFDKFVLEYKTFSNIYFKCIDKVKANFSNYRQNNIISMPEMVSVVSELKSIVQRDAQSILNLFNIQTFDRKDQFFVRSVNVALLSMIIGQSIHFSDDRISKIGLGALMYDIGMTKLTDKITEKVGTLTTEEYREMQKHTVYGYKILKNNLRLEELAIIALSHHENVDGSGYPRGIVGKDIHPYARIVGMAQALEGMLRNVNVHINRQRTLTEAISEIMNGANTKYDPIIVKAFVAIMNIYPIGTIVELSDGRRGFIFSVNKNYPMRPRIKIVSDEQGRYLNGGDTIDLVNNKNLLIKRVEDNHDFIKEVRVKLF